MIHSDTGLIQHSGSVVGAIFRDAVRKVKVLNRRKELKIFRLFDLINFIKKEKQRIAELNAAKAQESKLTPMAL